MLGSSNGRSALPILNNSLRGWRAWPGLVARFLVVQKGTTIHRTFEFRVAIVFVCFGILLARHVGAYAGSSDASGYMNDARLLASGDLHPAQRVVEGVPPEALPFMGYIPLGFLPLDHGKMYPTYPIGLPILLLMGSEVCGWITGPNVVMWLHAMACLWVAFLLFRELQLGPEMSLLGVILLGSSALFLFMSLQTMSDVPATLWATLAVLGCLKAKRRMRWAVLAGFCFGYGILVRPTSILMIFPILAFFPWSPRRGILFCLGGLPIAGFLGVMNSVLYGKVVTTGYGDLSALFGTRYIPPTLHNYVSSLPIELTPLVILALMFPFLGNGLRLSVRIGICVWILVFFAFYSAYYCTHEAWWYLRFVLPTYPALIACILFALNRMGVICSSFDAIGWILLVALIAVWNRHWVLKLTALDIGYGEKIYPETCEYIDRWIPPNSVILCMQESGAILYYTKNVIVRWDSISRENLPMLVDSCRKARRGLYMVLFPFEEADALKKFDRARWRQTAKVRDVSIWTLAEFQ
jgi:hypothetical protein